MSKGTTGKKGRTFTTGSRRSEDELVKSIEGVQKEPMSKMIRANLRRQFTDRSEEG